MVKHPPPNKNKKSQGVQFGLLAGHSCRPPQPTFLPRKWGFSHSHTTVAKCGEPSCMKIK